MKETVWIENESVASKEVDYTWYEIKYSVEESKNDLIAMLKKQQKYT